VKRLLMLLPLVIFLVVAVFLYRGLFLIPELIGIDCSLGSRGQKKAKQHTVDKSLHSSTSS